VGPSVLLHPLDFLGAEDDPELRFFPGMNLPREEKRVLLDHVLSRLTHHFRVMPMRQHAEAVRGKFGLPRPTRRPRPIAAEPLVAAGEVSQAF
jgi:hypothetical protein